MKRLILIASLLFPAFASAEIAFVGASADMSAVSRQVLTMAHTVTTGNVLIVYGATTQYSGACGIDYSATYSGQAMTKFGYFDAGVCGYPIFVMANPPAGTANIVISGPEGNTTIHALAGEFSGADTTTFIEDTGHGYYDDFEGNILLSVTTSEGSVVFDWQITAGDGYTADEGQTVVIENIASWKPRSGETTTTGWAILPWGYPNWYGASILVGSEEVPASGGGVKSFSGLGNAGTAGTVE